MRDEYKRLKKIIIYSLIFILLVIFVLNKVAAIIILDILLIIYLLIKYNQYDNEKIEYYKPLREFYLNNEKSYNILYKEYMNDPYVKKGIENENRIIKILERIFDRKNIFSNLLFIDKEIVTTEVDIIVVSKKGIYVIESKNYSGIILGNARYKNWKQLFRNSKYQIISNPIYQNKRHIRDIRELLNKFNINNNCYKSFIVFGDNCKLQIYDLDKVKDKVIKTRDLFYTILDDYNNSSVCISDQDLITIRQLMATHSKVSDDEKYKHIVRRKNNVIYNVKK